MDFIDINVTVSLGRTEPIMLQNYSPENFPKIIYYSHNLFSTDLHVTSMCA